MRSDDVKSTSWADWQAINQVCIVNTFEAGDFDEFFWRSCCRFEFTLQHLCVGFV